MASWAELETSHPDLMARARALFLIEQPNAPGPAGLAYLATVRADGGPRIHPISPAVLDGRLYAFILRRSPKAADLRRDPRFALHSWPLPFSDDGFDDEEVALTGRAIPVDDPDLAGRVAWAVGDVAASGLVFELAIETALHKHRRGGLTTTSGARTAPLADGTAAQPPIANISSRGRLDEVASVRSSE